VQTELNGLAGRLKRSGVAGGPESSGRAREALTRFATKHKLSAAQTKAAASHLERHLGGTRPNPLASMPPARGVRNVQRERAAEARGLRPSSHAMINGRRVPKDSLKPLPLRVSIAERQRRSAAARNSFGGQRKSPDDFNPRELEN
jgi:hypothetical protein